MSEELSDTLTVRNVTLTLYAGVIGKIDEAIGGFEKLDELPLNPNKQMSLVKAVLKKYDEEGNETGEYYLNPNQLSREEFETIYEWGLNHYQVFILSSSVKTMKILEKVRDEMMKAQNNS